MQRRHGPGRDASLEAIADNEVATVSQLFDERHERGEVVAVVGIGHDDEPPARRRDPSHERAAVALGLDRHDARAPGLGDGLRAVCAAVVGDDDLAGDAVVGEAGAGFLDADGERLGLVEARHHHADFG